MLNAIIDLSLRNRWLVLLASAALVVFGVLSMRKLDVDAFPDTTPVQVQINTVAPALGPAEIEEQLTFPVEQALGGLPGLESMRSVSKFGLSQVVVNFLDGTDIYFARQVISERLANVQLPLGVERPKMGPVSTGLGEVFHYHLIGQSDVVTELRTLHDWVVRPKMRTVKGTAEINSWGGYEKQYQIRIDPDKLIKHDLTFDQVTEAVGKNNRNVGGGSLRQHGSMLLVQGLGRLATLEQIRGIVIAAHDGVAIRVGDVGDVVIGHEVRRGAVTADGKGEVVMGLGFMRMGENSHEVTWNMKRRLEEIKPALPANVRIQPVYDRTELVDHVLDTVRANLFEGGLFVIVVLFAFLGNLRAATIVALAIPLSMLFAFCGMLRFGVAASLLSLGAIDFGMIVDSSVVMIENCVRHIAQGAPGKTRLELVRDAAVEVRKPTLFGELIIMIVYLPILTLEGTSGKLFRPMALTVIFALVGSMILSMTLMPVLASLLLPRKIEEREPLLMRLAHAIHGPILRFSMRYQGFVIGFALLVLTAAGLVAWNLGANFLPKLSEGAIVVTIARLPGTELEESIRYNTQMEKAILAAFPDQVEHVWSRIGTAEIATDPMGVELTDMFVTLKPRERWPKTGPSSQAELTDGLETLLRDMPGQNISFSQPIEDRMAEMETGIRSDVGIKVFGDDLDVLAKIGKQIKEVVDKVHGAKDVTVEKIQGQPVLQIRVKQEAIARYGVPATAVLDLVESIGSKPLGEVVEGQIRFPLVVRLPEKHRQSSEAIGAMLVPTATGERIPLSRLADVEVTEGPSTITRDMGQRRILITCNVRGRDLASFVAEAQRAVAAEVAVPPGRYHLAWEGQYERLISATQRLIVSWTLTVLLVVALLWFAYRNVVDTLRVLTGIPFACAGGVFALWLRGMPFSLPAAVGFIALSGVAVLDGMILVSYVRQLRRAGLKLDDAVQQAAITRLRPVLMTTLVASLGFLPMALSTGMGSEVQRPLATVVIGGVIGAMVMSLLVLRVLYVAFGRFTERSAN